MTYDIGSDGGEAGRETDAVVRYAILGPVRAVRGTDELHLGPPKRLALFALLVLRAPGPLTLSEAIDVLWDDEPPASAANVVHRHIGALRRTLEPRLRSRSDARHLVRAADGYRLLVDASNSDLLHFRDLCAQARIAARAGDPARAAHRFAEALRLWRGPVVADGSLVSRHPVFTAVGHEFVAVVKEASDVVLTAAPALTEDLLTALRRALDGHPFDEALHARMIAALAATGRQAEALRQFDRIRHRLADELGVDPGPELRAAQQHLSQRTPTVPVNGPADPEPAAPVPSQLPQDCPSFVGRHAALDRFLRLLPLDGERPAPAITAALCGMAGVGKTTLAVHVAHLAAARYPGGQVYVDLRGHHPSQAPLDPGEAMRTVLEALGTETVPAQPGAAALGSAYRRALAGRRLLLVLDDARDSEQVRPLLPTTPGCLTIVTSRRRLEGLAVTDDARIVTLDPMTRRESLDLLERRLGADRLRGEHAAAEEIVEVCGGLPLTLAVAATRVLLQPAFSLASLAAQLRDGRSTLAALSTLDVRTDVRSAFTASYEALSHSAASLFRLLSLHPARDITAPAAASLAGTDVRDTHADIAELTDHHLLAELVPGRYTCHGLLRAFSAELGSRHDPADARSAARARMVEHYLYSADAATALLAPHRRALILPPPRPGVRPQRFHGRAEAAEWIVAERHLLPSLVEDTGLLPGAGGETFRRQLRSTLRTFAHRADG
ncbi:BTAD domain-containing putative transcriptional regulator [Streptomyces sp. NPDC004457]